MLTKSLTRFNTRKGRIFPTFVDPGDEDLLATAHALVAVFEKAQGMSRAGLAGEVQAIIEAREGETVVGRGLEKLLLDRTRFDAPDDDSTPALRHQVFSAGSRILAAGDIQIFDDYSSRLETAVATPLADLRTRLYSDLPALHPVISFKPITAEQLLHRYNCAQVQWLLLHCHKLEIRLPAKKTASLRQLFKYLRFHQLLATIDKPAKGVYRIELSGPMSMFYQTKRYGLNLARFFPALLHQSGWEMSAEIAVANRKPGVLVLDESAGIRPLDERFHAYIPDEIKKFRKSFARKIVGWRIEPNPDFLALKGESYCFPDYRLIHESGYAILLELFHPWHDLQLGVRLEQVSGQSTPPLILGVARKLAGRSAIAERLASSAYFHDYGFQFRDLPVPGQVKPILARLLEATD